MSVAKNNSKYYYLSNENMSEYSICHLVSKKVSMSIQCTSTNNLTLKANTITLYQKIFSTPRPTSWPAKAFKIKRYLKRTKKQIYLWYHSSLCQLSNPVAT